METKRLLELAGMQLDEGRSGAADKFTKSVADYLIMHAKLDLEEMRDEDPDIGMTGSDIVDRAKQSVKLTLDEVFPDLATHLENRKLVK